MIAAVEVVSDTVRASVLLDETRLALLDQLEEPASAATLGRRLDLPRQRVNYHLRELENQELVVLVEERKRGNVTERLYQRTGHRYAIASDALGALGSAPAEVQDRFSSEYQITLASRVISDLATLRRGAAKVRKKLPTLALEAEVRFASAEQRNEFSEELANAVAALVRKYHDTKAARGRSFKFYLGAYPKPK